MLRDRGRIKWTAMMLPEHVRELRKWQEEIGKVSRPELDEFDIQVMQEELQRALATNADVRLTTWINGEPVYHRGKLEEMTEKGVTFTDPFGLHRLTWEELVGVLLLE
ncbi:YolD-like family protein [Paenisporosarcina cavernae]|uniref:YolD-like family protein n=1 Tax=Paenisporosarcina cavernae TaxID=2320858 RepID=A0A385YSK7_9BACL|nr:YolD-like family protein [Paenisporosarcina cavernae]AYC29504.1 YolD-like family protein [Paenisporosarcina cavernae]